ncbi:MAG: Mov34/MPN/PAD-1 family protein [Planctomycetota bacterium]
MISTTHQLVVEILKPDGAVVGQARASLECFEPAVECLRFHAMRCGRLPLVFSSPLVARVAPRFDAHAGPTVRSFDLQLLDASNGAPAQEFIGAELPLSLLDADAVRVVRALTRAGKLAETEPTHFRVLGFATESPSVDSDAPSTLTLEAVPRPLHAAERMLTDFEQRATLVGDREAAEFQVFLPAGLLAEAEAMKLAAGEVETGGILIGHLHRDSVGHDLFLEVTAQIPLEHAPAERYRLSFTAATWTAAQAAIDLRRRDELMVGWWHSHPARHWKCRDCPPASRLTCPLAQQFFSAADRALHATIYTYAAFAVALVLGDRPRADGDWDDAAQLYGWKRGEIAARSFHRLRDEPAVVPRKE